ncbi:uncharacterized protein LOC108099569 [Drosophila ficusphila]|uniref:uncharacterized protein LOC108099569 n=1 Tax=Drosophila ficusphila TaxID=30025 RepID=UPI001C8A4557|nr:uncharacterized protein LOC108099569 [Drosophila ficusphila]
MSKPQNDDTLELEDILSQPVKDKERLAAFMLRKLAENKPPQNDNLFGNFKLDLNLDFDVPLVKKPKQRAPEAQPLQKLTSPTSSTSAQSNKPPVDQESNENRPPLTSPTLSPNHRRSLRRSGNVPSADKLRRHAIRRRSRSCGRQLLPEFNDAVNVTRSFSSPENFVPKISSTPCAEKPKETAVQSPVEELAQNVEEKAKNPETREEKSVRPEVMSPAKTSSPAAEIAELCMERRNSFHSNVLQLDYTGRAPYSRPGTPSSPSGSGARRTYTMERGPAPGQLLLSPSQRNSYIPVKQPVVKMKRINQEVVVPNTPERPSHEPAWQSQPQPEFVVPETQPQDLGELVQTLSRTASCPIVVINTQSPNKSVRRDSVQLESVPSSQAATIQAPTSSELKAPTSSELKAPTSSELKAPASPPESRGQISRVEENLNAIMTDDESDEQTSTVALNLAPPGGNTTRQRRLRNNNRNRVTAEAQESSMRLLDLHRSVNAKKTMTRMTTIPLNKAPSAPINGEQFAIELTRMSNYEILDLRKRNSLNEVYPLNGHRKRSSKQKIILEEEIQRELQRRKLMDEVDGLPGKPSSGDSEDSDTWEPVQRRSSRRRGSKERTQRKSRSKRRDLPMTNELKNYLGLSTTIEARRKLSQEGKRSLYTKGDSVDEDHFSSSPVKLPRLSRSIQIVPPPPASLRFSQSLQHLHRSNKFDFDHVMPAPPEFHDEPERNTTEIAPPPLQFVECTPTSPPEPDLQNEDDEQPIMSRSRVKKKDNQLVPPPMEYIEETEFERIKKLDRANEQQRRSQKSGKKPQLSNRIDPNTDKIEMVPLPFEYNEPPEPPEDEKDDSDDGKPRRSHRNEKKSQSSKTFKKRQGRAKCFRLQWSIMIALCTTLAKKLKRGGRKKEEVPHTLECIKDPNDKKTGSTSEKRVTRNLETSSSKNKSHNNIVISKTSSTREEDVIEKSDRMESLRVSTPTPPLDPGDVPGRNQTSLEASLADDVPSTSRAALEALQRSQSKAMIPTPEVTNDDVVFKKPLMRAPRARSKKSKSEVDKLKLSKIPVETEDQDHDTSGIRRSKRGQKPLQMSWCHTMDPTQFDFMSNYVGTQNRGSKLNKRTPSRTKKTSVPGPKPSVPENSTESRGPLCSSTPRISDKGPENMPNSESLGVSPLAWEESAVLAEAKKEPKRRRGRPKKGVEAEQSENGSEPELGPMEPLVTPLRNDEEEQYQPMVSSVTPSVDTQERAPISEPGREHIVSSVSSIRNEQEEASIQLMNWLRGVSDAQPVVSMSEGNSSVSHANELMFTQVDGIDYAFYNTKEKATLGYMRFKPHQTRNKKRAKVHPLKFVVQFGEFTVQTMALGEEQGSHFVLRVGDMIQIEPGTKYSIQNSVDSVSVLLVIRS